MKLKTILHYIGLILLSTYSLSSYAIYQCKDEHGNKKFQDTPCAIETASPNNNTLDSKSSIIKKLAASAGIPLDTSDPRAVQTAERRFKLNALDAIPAMEYGKISLEFCPDDQELIHAFNTYKKAATEFVALGRHYYKTGLKNKSPKQMTQHLTRLTDRYRFVHETSKDIKKTCGTTTSYFKKETAKITKHNALVEFKSASSAPKKSSRKRPQKVSCEFTNLDLPKDFAVFAAGEYSGRKLNFQIDQSGHAATQFDILVHNPDKPVALMLGAYEPTIWNISWSKQTEIVAVFATGYHRQVLAGLEPHVPTLISSYEDKGACGHFYINKRANKKLNPRARKLFGQAVDLVYPGDSSGTIHVGKSTTSKIKFLTSSATPPESYRDTSQSLAGPMGLQSAVKSGHLRRATRADAEAWVNAIVKKTQDDDVPPISGQGKPRPSPPRLFNGYVVLKAFTFPAGLYGGHSATFYVPKGVAKPSGNPGHSTVYDFNTLQCSGPSCAR